ncbi:MAG: HEAT repeat domain-containing protein [Balneolaceae bacterium]|nr:HEAT repeat domain-containing protein [Balneolaceae bacterium]
MVRSLAARGALGRRRGHEPLPDPAGRRRATAAAGTAGGAGEGNLPLTLDERPGDSTAAGPYGVFGPAAWNRWQRGLPAWEGRGLKRVIRESIGGVLSEGPGVYGWEDYASGWYRSSGQPLFDPPDLADVVQGREGMQAGPEGGRAASDSVIYRVDYRLDEANGSLRLVFNARKGVYSELTALRGIAFGAGGGRDTTEVTFTGASDSVQVSVPPTARTFTLEGSAHPNLYLEQYKPAPYLIYEIRNAESLEQRVEAARRLGSHTGNPDLQLAIQDFMGGDPHPRVRAALMLSLADITGGAAGTEQQFLDALDSGSREVRDAALMALQNYPDNDRVRSRVESLAMGAEAGPLYRNAVRVLSSIGNGDQLNDFTARVIRSDTLGRKAIFAIGLLSGTGATDQAVDYAEHYTVPRFPYDVRVRAIGLLSQFNRSATDWVARAEELLGDPDPRIRYLAVRALDSFSAEAARELLQRHLAEEYDARVRPASTSRSP